VGNVADDLATPGELGSRRTEHIFHEGTVEVPIFIAGGAWPWYSGRSDPASTRSDSWKEGHLLYV
jgi:hypothetical protein